MCAFVRIPKLLSRGLQHYSFIPLWPTCRTQQWHNPECGETTKQQNLRKPISSARDVLKEQQLLTVVQPAATSSSASSEFQECCLIGFNVWWWGNIGSSPPEINVWFKSFYNLHSLFLALIVWAHVSGWIKKNNNNLRMPSAQSGTLLCTCLRINQSGEDREPCSDPQWKHEQHINTQAKSYEKQTSIHTHFHCEETN